ncbi:MAG: hypothetical protein L3K18_04815 [Thermoplasmata archaeon]|nr:hypothetical protein [Thermoplasmata archaeon]
MRRCPGGANASNRSCTCVFLVTEPPRNSAGTPLRPWNLNVEIINSNGSILNFPFTVTGVDLLGAGCGLAQYEGANNIWGPSVSPSECHDLNGSTAPIQEGDVFELAPIPPGGLPFSGAGDPLVLIGVGAFAGQVGARIG